MNIQKIREVFLKIVLSLLFFNIFYLPILILNNISAIEILTLMIVSIIIEFIITKLYRLLFKIDEKVRIPVPISTTIFLISILSSILITKVNISIKTIVALITLNIIFIGLGKVLTAIDKKLSNIIHKLDD
ncbi:hypothetical protein [Gemella morbillorum]|uniref:hypothetical protein n=1 Tax=Gemella morbillorum TaxID=29391 RepID=UPI00319DDB10